MHKGNFAAHKDIKISFIHGGAKLTPQFATKFFAAISFHNFVIDLRES